MTRSDSLFVVAAVVAVLVLSAPFAMSQPRMVAEPADLECPDVLALLCSRLPMAPGLEDDVTIQHPPEGYVPINPEIVPPANACAAGCI